MNAMYDNSKRTELFKKNSSLEKSLSELNALINKVEVPVITDTKLPIVLIMGCARSGTTLVLQYLASLGIFSYPSNFIARFYKNPYIGILAQQVLIERDTDKQLGISPSINYKSDLGKTTGALAPSEFWYFWREYFKFKGIEHLTNEELSSIDSDDLLKKLGSFELLSGKPLVMKAMMLNNHIPYLYSINPNFIFINIERDTVYNAQSLLIAREKFFGDKEKWYSFKPLEYDRLKKLGPVQQVVQQVICTKRAVQKGLRCIPVQNKINITYEEFCKTPHSLSDKIQEVLSLHNSKVTNNVINKTCKLHTLNKQKLNGNEFLKIIKYTQECLP